MKAGSRLALIHGCSLPTPALEAKKPDLGLFFIMEARLDEKHQWEKQAGLKKTGHGGNRGK